jgi:hypothetical protein
VLLVIGISAISGGGKQDAQPTTPTQTSEEEATPSTPGPETPPSGSGEGGNRGESTGGSSGEETPGEDSGEPAHESSGEEDEVGSPSHATDSQFCSEHECIGSFETEPGTIVECSDGAYSHSGGLSGACSHHGGES